MLVSIQDVQAKTYTKKQCKQYAYQQVLKKGWSINDYNNLVKLWQKESSWNAKARNKRSGACGIPQANPCSKMKKYGKDYKTNDKLIIIDEASMMDLPLASRLITSMHNSARLIIVGDVDQLPSVGPGQVLKDLIDSKIGKNLVPLIILWKITYSSPKELLLKSLIPFPLILNC